MYYLKGIISTTVVRNLVPPQLQDNFHHDPLDIRRSHQENCTLLAGT